LRICDIVYRATSLHVAIRENLAERDANSNGISVCIQKDASFNPHLQGVARIADANPLQNHTPCRPFLCSSCPLSPPATRRRFVMATSVKSTTLTTAAMGTLFAIRLSKTLNSLARRHHADSCRFLLKSPTQRSSTPAVPPPHSIAFANVSVVSRRYTSHILRQRRPPYS
jgi:hypothetical protein